MNDYFKPTEDELEYIAKLSAAYNEEYVLIRLTETMCTKSIIDAGESLRFLLSKSGIISFEEIEQGQKILKQSLIFSGQEVVEKKVSYYRPETKNGDPRFWVYGLSKFAQEGQLVYLTAIGDVLVCIPLEIDGKQLESYTQFARSQSGEDEILTILRTKLHEVKMSGWIESVSPLFDAPKDVGETLESAMGVKVNNLQTPDFMGKIELKAKRSKARTMDSLFSKVPDWDISNYKSVLDIVARFGYLNNDWPMKRLYNDIRSSPNAQGLYNWPDDKESVLYQKFSMDDNEEDVCAWRYSTVRKALVEKHPTTLWVEAKTNVIDGKHHFKYDAFELSSRPNFSEFIRLIRQDKVIYDWKAKIKPNGTSIRNHGPGFRISPKNRVLLFNSLIQLK